MDSTGTLYIVATPIGNMEDISRRALAVLSNVDLIAAEDTRHTGLLLKHFGISRPLLSFFSYNEQKRIPGLVQTLTSGKSVAIVSDAGTPGISDPATSLVRAAIEAGITVVSVPGAAAFLTALVASGLPTDRFVFEGFLPLKKGRKTRLERLRTEERTIILYESPHRIGRTLREMGEVFGDRRAVVARELTKKFEEFARGTLPELASRFSDLKARGEFVVLVEGFRNRPSGEKQEGSRRDEVASV